MLNTALRLKATATKAKNKVITRTKRDIERMNMTKDKRGDATETEFLRIARQYLGGLKEVWLSEPHSELDNEVYADLVIVLEADPEYALLVQIKSSREAARRHLERGTVCGGKYNVPGVVWRDTPWNMLLQLRDVTGIPFHKRVNTMLDVAEKLRGQKITTSAFPHLNNDFMYLGLASYSDNFTMLKFKESPPPLIFHDPIE